MRVSKLFWTRYRSFKESQCVELAPLTIIIGRNGSGKSVISRLPVLLAGGVAADATDPLNLEAGGIDHAATFQDLVHQRGRLTFSLGAQVSGDGVCIEFQTTLRYVSESRALVVEKFSLIQDKAVILNADLSDVSQLTSRTPTYHLSGGVSLPDVVLPFTGLLPSIKSFQGGIRDALEFAFDQIRAALPPPSYLGPFRVEATRSNRAPSQRVTELGSRGQRAIELLADDKLRFDGALASEVSNWFSSALGQGIVVDVSDDLTRILVTDPRHQVEVSLADTGAGLAQVLPIVVQHFAFRRARIAASTLIVEQPELHLHPAAHGAVMDLALGSLSHHEGAARPTCLIETHSEQLIMRLRRRIAEGLDPSSVAIWSLNHREEGASEEDTDPLRVIKFDLNGSPDAWPSGVFEESLDDLKELRRAARERLE